MAALVFGAAAVRVVAVLRRVDAVDFVAVFALVDFAEEDFVGDFAGAFAVVLVVAFRLEVVFVVLVFFVAMILP